MVTLRFYSASVKDRSLFNSVHINGIHLIPEKETTIGEITGVFFQPNVTLLIYHYKLFFFIDFEIHNRSENPW